MASVAESTAVESEGIANTFVESQLRSLPLKRVQAVLADEFQTKEPKAISQDAVPTVEITPQANDIPADDVKPYDMTPLMTALTKGDIEEARALLDSGVDVNERNSYGDTALHMLWAYRADITRIQRRYWPFEPGLRQPWLVNQQAITPNSKIKEMMALLLQYGADESAKSSDSQYTPSQMGYWLMTAWLGEEKAQCVMGSKRVLFSKLLGQMPPIWSDQRMLVLPLCNGTWLGREANETEKEGRPQSEYAQVIIASPSPCDVNIAIQTCGAVPLDADWKYFWIVRLGRFSAPEMPYTIEIEIKHLQRGKTFTVNYEAKDILPESNHIYTLAFGPLEVSEGDDLQMSITTKSLGDFGIHGGLVLVDAQLQVEHSPYLFSPASEQHVEGVHIIAKHAIASIETDIADKLRFPGPSTVFHTETLPAFTAPWDDISFSLSATASRNISTTNTFVAVRYLAGVFAYILVDTALVTASGAQSWDLSWMWWLLFVLDRCQYERHIIEMDRLHFTLGSLLSASEYLHNFGFLANPAVVHWALHHGSNVLLKIAEKRISNLAVFGMTPWKSFMAVCVAVIVFHRIVKSPALLAFVVSRSMTFYVIKSSGKAEPHPIRVIDFVMDNEWIWWVASSSVVWGHRQRYYRISLSCSTALLLCLVVFEVVRGNIAWRQLLPTTWLFTSCFAAVILMVGLIG